ACQAPASRMSTLSNGGPAMPRLGFGLLITVGAALLLALAAVPPAEGGKDDWTMLFNGKDTTGWKLRQETTTVIKYLDSAGNVIADAKTVKVDQKEVAQDAKGKEIKGAKIVEQDKKKVVVDADGTPIKDAKVAKVGGRDAIVDKPKLVEKDGVKVEVFDTHQCGAIYGLIAPSKNMAKKPTEWQSFDVVFHGARGEPGQVTKKARVTLIWNGERVIDDAEISG